MEQALLSNFEVTQILFLHVIHAFPLIHPGEIYDQVISSIKGMKASTHFEIEFGKFGDAEFMIDHLKRDGLFIPIFGGTLTQRGMEMLAAKKPLVETILGTELR